MSINELGGGQPHGIPSGPHFDVTGPNRAGKAANSDSAKVETGNQSGFQHVRDPEVVNLVKQLDHNSEVRADLIERVTQKLENGEYLTRQAAEDVASEILNQI